jgi:hypothetical protein
MTMLATTDVVPAIHRARALVCWYASLNAANEVNEASAEFRDRTWL